MNCLGLCWMNMNVRNTGSDRGCSDNGVEGTEETRGGASKTDLSFNIIVLDLYNTLMKDTECVRFMQWALPRLRMRWPGFRKVRRQVCKRINRRIRELRLNDVKCYREYLQVHQDVQGMGSTGNGVKSMFDPCC